jgi:hypothetical protein
LTRRELLIVALTFVGVLLLVAMLFVTILGVLGRGLMGEVMAGAHGVMFFVMVFFPLFAVGLLAALGWWILKREGG